MLENNNDRGLVLIKTEAGDETIDEVDTFYHCLNHFQLNFHDF